MTLAPDGNYYYGHEAGYFGDFTDQYGDKLGAWDATGQSQNRGRWIIRGDRQKGVIIITFQDGTESTLEYQVHVEKGQTYWNEYWIDGSHYSRSSE
jgi:hypothetical protein